MSRARACSGQLGFDAMLAEADDTQRRRVLDRETAHMPDTIDEALPYFLRLIDRHHAAMLAGDAGTTMALRREAHSLALKLNGGEPGILADDDAPGRVLERLSAATPGAVPLWGQRGDFIITVGMMRVRIDLNGIFGIGSSVGYWPGFAAHVVDRDAPVLSDTGYRSFLGLQGEAVGGMTPETFAASVIARYLAQKSRR